MSLIWRLALRAVLIGVIPTALSAQSEASGAPRAPTSAPPVSAGSVAAHPSAPGHGMLGNSSAAASGVPSAAIEEQRRLSPSNVGAHAGTSEVVPWTRSSAIMRFAPHTAGPTPWQSRIPHRNSGLVALSGATIGRAKGTGVVDGSAVHRKR